MHARAAGNTGDGRGKEGASLGASRGKRPCPQLGFRRLPPDVERTKVVGLGPQSVGLGSGSCGTSVRPTGQSLARLYRAPGRPLPTTAFALCPIPVPQPY